MADKEDSTTTDDKQKQQVEEANSNYKADDNDNDDDDSSSDEDDDDEQVKGGRRKGSVDDDDDDDDDDSDDDDDDDDDDGENTFESNTKILTDLMNSKSYKKKLDEEDEHLINPKDVFDFPKDPEKWTEEDLEEIWADGPLEGDNQKTGWDPKCATQEDLRYARNQIYYGQEPALAPFYLPYKKGYPPITNNNTDISTPKTVIEELDRIEEFLKWVSFIFEDGSSYEGTVWDDYAHGKGVYVAEHRLLRYEGEWMQNQMEGHGVVEVDVPAREPAPGSKLEDKMRAQGKIISRDFMPPEDRKWLEMDIEDSFKLAGGWRETPFDENYEWIKLFGKKPEQGRYRYAGQWKHGRMHGCGVYEVNERPIFGRFYFGELLDDSTGCDEDVSTLHAGIAEVAAAKARMFVNKPDGMVREQRGPYCDPQHPYLYEEDDVWMAPGFINQFYEVPDYWKTYAHEVDEEREMWLNSFYKAPLRIPMPAELEHWWSKDQDTEFVLVNCDPVPDPEDPSRLVYKEDPLILHVPTGRLINYIEDEKHGVRLFWQPVVKEGEEELEEVNIDKLDFLPLGFDEFFGRKSIRPEENKEGEAEKVVNAMSLSDRLSKWFEEKKKKSEMKLQLIEKELEFIEAELSLEETIEDMEMELKRAEKEEEKMEMSQRHGKNTSAPTENFTPDAAEEDEAEEEENGGDDDDDDDDDNDAPTSFGSVAADQDSAENDKGDKRGKSPFSTLSLSFSPSNLVSTVPSKLHESFASWKNGRRCPTSTTMSPRSIPWKSTDLIETSNSVSFPVVPIRYANLKTNISKLQRLQKTSIRLSPLHSIAQLSSNSNSRASSSGHTISQGKQRSNNTHNQQQRKSFKVDVHDILSLHFPIDCPET